MSGQKIKCLVIIVNWDKGEQVAELCRLYQLYFTYGIFALGATGPDLLGHLEIGETDRELLFRCFSAQLEHEVMYRTTKKIRIRKMGHDIMFITPSSRISSLFQRKILYGRVYEEEGTGQKERKYESAIAVAEHGWRDQITEAAKEANATGGTVLHARFLYEDDTTSFPGIRLQGEEDIAVILSAHKNYKQIMYEINMVAGLQTEAKGPILSIPVDEFIGM